MTSQEAREMFIQKYLPTVTSLTAGTGIFPATMLTQAILESSKKNSEGVWIPGMSTLATAANNFFGIKADSSWQGDTYTTEIITGMIGVIPQIERLTYRAYKSANDGFRDYVSFLTSNPRYTSAGVFNASNPEQQFQRLKAAGYAEDVSYVDKLTAIYEALKNEFVISGGGAVIATLAAASLLLYLFFNNKNH